MSGNTSNGGSGSGEIGAGGVDAGAGSDGGAVVGAATGGASEGRRGFRRKMTINRTPIAAITARIPDSPPTAKGPGPRPPRAFPAASRPTQTAEVPAAAAATATGGVF